MSKYDNYNLCYVEGGRWGSDDLTLFFTERDLGKQKGDDWNNRPYEHNAGRPYTEDYSKELGVENGRGIYPKIDILKVILSINDWSCNLITPCSNTDNSIYCVNDINIDKLVPWIIIDVDKSSRISIWAGTTFKEFLNKVKDLNCVDVLVPLNRFKNDYSNTGVLVKNNKDGKIGVVLRENKSTGQVQVLEKIQPKVINTHDNWNTLSIIDFNE